MQRRRAFVADLDRPHLDQVQLAKIRHSRYFIHAA
jgi:hypothetical protein